MLVPLTPPISIGLNSIIGKLHILILLESKVRTPRTSIIIFSFTNCKVLYLTEPKLQILGIKLHLNFGVLTNISRYRMHMEKIKIAPGGGLRQCVEVLFQHHREPLRHA